MIGWLTGSSSSPRLSSCWTAMKRCALAFGEIVEPSSPGVPSRPTSRLHFPRRWVRGSALSKGIHANVLVEGSWTPSCVSRLLPTSPVCWFELVRIAIVSDDIYACSRIAAFVCPFNLLAVSPCFFFSFLLFPRFCLLFFFLIDMETWGRSPLAGRLISGTDRHSAFGNIFLQPLVFGHKTNCGFFRAFLPD
ncbi:hypothetical protein CPSG_08912 [Coccidioides posadasii str. Silveira]|uniref:Uncharacterized protein n=1 Tax=Coccidioides posadasii (strain RMSCC 757 / Silveira) TaxID=443226 RepID=E9DGG3_COCPS|nr:hypothetical protein CPSG_08912 [Coccidioides posadasii str. Silveira]